MCSLGMMLGTPFLFLALVVAQYKILYLGWVRIFITVHVAALIATACVHMYCHCVVCTALHYLAFELLRYCFV